MLIFQERKKLLPGPELEPYISLALLAHVLEIDYIFSLKVLIIEPIIITYNRTVNNNYISPSKI